MANLGTLTLDLIARTGGFTGPLDKAGRESKKHMKQIADSATTAKNAMDLLGASFSIGTVAYFTADVIKASMALEGLNRQFAVVAGNANLGAREFEFVRESADKLGMNVNDLSTTYSRFMNAVKGTVNEGQAGRNAFIGLSEGMAAVGLSADEQSRAWAQLSQGIMKGKFEMEDLKTIQETGLPITRLMAEALGITTEELFKMQKEGKLLVADVLPKLGEAMHNTYGGAAAESAKSAQAEINRFNNAMLETKQIAGKALLPVFTDIVRMAKPAIESLQKIVQSVQILGVQLAANQEKRATAWDNLISGRGMFSKEGLDRQKKAADEADKRANEQIESILRGTNAATSAYTDLEIAKQKAIKPAKIVDEKAEAAAKALAKAIKEQVKAITDQADVLGWSEKSIKLYELAMKGASISQLSAAGKALDAVDAYKAEQESIKDLTEASIAYMRMMDDLKTDEEKYIDKIKERIDIIQMAGQIMDEETAKRLVESGVTKAPTFGGVDATVGGASGEIAKMDTALEELENWKNLQIEKQDMIQEFADQESELFRAAEEKKLRIYQEYMDKKWAIDTQRTKTQQEFRLSNAQNEIGIYSQLADTMGDITKNFAGESSAAYKAMFALQKIFAAAMIIANTEIAASKAGAELGIFGLPLAGMIRAAGYASATMVAGMGLAGMAHDGIDSVPQTGTWLLQKGERVTTAETSAKLDRTLESVSKQSSGGGEAPIVNLYEDKSKAGMVESRNEDNRNVIDIWVADLMGDGKAQKAMSRKFGLKPVGA